nr:hypothetical protein CFP56_09161 [Quercus suber]
MVLCSRIRYSGPDDSSIDGCKGDHLSRKFATAMAYVTAHGGGAGGGGDFGGAGDWKCNGQPKTSRGAKRKSWTIA